MLNIKVQNRTLFVEASDDSVTVVDWTQIEGENYEVDGEKIEMFEFQPEGYPNKFYIIPPGEFTLHVTNPTENSKDSRVRFDGDGFHGLDCNMDLIGAGFSLT